MKDGWGVDEYWMRDERWWGEGWWGGGVVGWWDGEMVGLWDGGMVGRRRVRWWDDGMKDEGW